MGNNVSKEPVNLLRGTSIRSRISSKRWSTPQIPAATIKESSDNPEDLSPKSDRNPTLQFQNLTDKSDASVSKASTIVSKAHNINDQNENSDIEHLIGQLEALLENPRKYSTHHEIIARLAHQASNVLEGSCLVHQLRELIEEPDKFSKYEKELTILTRRAATLFENPYQTYHRIAYSGLPLVISRVAQQCNLFKTLVSNKDKAFDAAALTEITGINKDVLEVILEYMAAQHLVEDTGNFFYRANNVTINLLQPIATHGIPVLYVTYIFSHTLHYSGQLNKNYSFLKFGLANVVSI